LIAGSWLNYWRTFRSFESSLGGTLFTLAAEVSLER